MRSLFWIAVYPNRQANLLYQKFEKFLTNPSLRYALCLTFFAGAIGLVLFYLAAEYYLGDLENRGFEVPAQKMKN